MLVEKGNLCKIRMLIVNEEQQRCFILVEKQIEKTSYKFERK